MINKLGNYKLTTSVQSVYNFDEVTLQDLLNKFFAKLDETILFCNDVNERNDNLIKVVFPQFQEFIKNEFIPKSTKDYIDEKIKDGTILEMIDIGILSSINTRVADFGYNIRLLNLDETGTTSSVDKLMSINKNLVLSNGTYLIDKNCTLNGVYFAGGKFKIINNAKLILKDIFCPFLYQIFDNINGSVQVINSNKIGYPEYFGAIANNGACDCTKAINDTIKYFDTTHLQLADYFCNDTIVINTSRKTIKGHSNYQLAEQKGTRIIVNSSTKDTMFVGYDSPPNDIVNYITNVKISNIELGRSIVPTSKPSGEESSSPKGLLIKYCYMCDFEYLRTTEHSIGYYITGTVYCHFRRCTAFRSLQGTTPINDFWFGFLINGVTNIGLASGNASLYLTDCNSSIGGNVKFSETVGALVIGRSADLFMTGFETSNTNSGIIIQGDNSKEGNVDVHIIKPIIDTFKDNGIYFQNIGKYGCIDLSNGYFAPVGGSLTSYCVRFDNFLGSANLTNNQSITWQNDTALGLFINNSSGVVSKNNSVLGCKRPISIINSNNIIIEDVINNPEQKGTQGAVYIVDSNRCYIKPLIKGITDSFPQGVYFNGTNSKWNEVNCSTIDSSCITGGSANKVLYNTTQVTTNTSFGTGNITTGIMV